MLVKQGAVVRFPAMTRDLSLIQSIYIGYMVHSVSYSVRTGSCSSGNKVTGACAFNVFTGTTLTRVFDLMEQFGRYSDSVCTGQFRVRTPVWANFSAPVQTGLDADPASCTRGMELFPGSKSAGARRSSPNPF